MKPTGMKPKGIARSIRPTSDRKTRSWNNQFNTFGLLPGPDATCPGATTGRHGCWSVPPGRRLHTCYVDNLLRCYGGVEPILRHNTEVLKSANYAAMVELLDQEFGRFEAAEARHAQRTKTAPDLRYRLHWSGDIYSKPYARAIRTAVLRHPRCLFWIYTRSFRYVPDLLDAPNLIIILSLDRCNKAKGLACFHRYSYHRNLRLAYMSPVNDLNAAAPINLLTCPVDTHKIPLENGCHRCGICTRRSSPASVWFRC